MNHDYSEHNFWIGNNNNNIAGSREGSMGFRDYYWLMILHNASFPWPTFFGSDDQLG